MAQRQADGDRAGVEPRVDPRLLLHRA